MSKLLRKILNAITATFLIFFILLFGLLPFGFIYKLSDFVAWVLRRIFKYRLSVIEENLSKSDLNINASEKKKLIAGIYQNLADILLESLKSFTMGRKSIIKRHKVLNPEIAQPYFEKQQSIILVTGHIGNWEWGSLSAGLQTPYHILGFYKKIKNPFVDSFLRWSRSRFGTTLASIRETSLSFQRQSGIPTLFLMAADQNPTKKALAHKVWFLGRDTAFLHGPEKHAKINQFPVVFAEIERVKRGYYELTLSVLVEDPKSYSDGEITQLYAQKLEAFIRKNPSQWLWSHKRWKHSF